MIKITNIQIFRIIGALLIGMGGLLSDNALADNSKSAARWAWLKGTIWTVPPNNVLAYELDYGNGNPPATPPTLVALNDQTVYVIDGYDKGFVWGTTVLAKQPANGGDITYSCGSLLGSISPEGSLLFGIMVPPGIQAAWFPGNMIKVGGKWTMQNLKVGSYTHWAYMVQSKPTDASYNDLPFVHLSVPEMLAKCPNFTPTRP